MCWSSESECINAIDIIVSCHSFIHIPTQIRLCVLFCAKMHYLAVVCSLLTATTLAILPVQLIVCDDRPSPAVPEQKKSSPPESPLGAVDDIRAHLESMVRAIVEPIATKSTHSDHDADLSLPSSASPSSSSSSTSGHCSANDQTDCSSPSGSGLGDSITSALLGSFPSLDYSNMRMDQLLQELISLTHKYPDQVDSVIATYRTLVDTMSK